MLTLPQWLKPVAVIEHIPWWHGKISAMLKRKTQQLAYSVKGIEHHLMVHAQDEDTMRKYCLVRGAFVSQNIYICEDIFNPMALEKLYDAIYVAQLQSFKRHELAREIKRLYIACSGDLKSFCPDVAHAQYNKKNLNPQELAKKINHSYCSLALSKVEGGMLASFESLLCGVPVVTTPSKGGRDEFLDSDNSILVPPGAQAVAAAVEHWNLNPPNPQMIRAKALKQLAVHRRRFCTYVATLIEHHGGGNVTPEQLYNRYFNHQDGILSRFIWANKFNDPNQLEKFQND